MRENISTERILEKLDSYLHKNDYESARRHLIYWLAESKNAGDHRAEILILNELMGLYRKLGRGEQALECVTEALDRIDTLGISEQVGAATSFLNCATVYKAFGQPERSILLFEKAKLIYERELDKTDGRLAGLYNNMGLTLVDLGRFEEAYATYEKALDILKESEGGELEMAITYLNMASACEAELGLVDADEKIQSYMDKAEDLLERYTDRGGYYAFVCEKCASVFGYYGRFVYEGELLERARRIYESEGN